MLFTSAHGFGEWNGVQLPFPKSLKIYICKVFYRYNAQFKKRSMKNI